MTVFDNIKAFNIGEFAEWIDKYCQYDVDSPWSVWFEENYCSKCEAVICDIYDDGHEHECSWCEVNDWKCKYFPERDEYFSTKDIIEMWLASEYVYKEDDRDIGIVTR